MGNNFFTKWVDAVSKFRPTVMNAPLEELDKAISYAKNIQVHCDGEIWWDKTAGKIFWDSTITLLYNKTDGKATKNTIAANTSGLAVADNQFVYVDLSETEAAALTAAVATVTTNSASNFIAVARLVLAYRNTASDDLFLVAFKAKMQNHPSLSTTDATQTTIWSKTLTQGKAYTVKATVTARQGDITDNASFTIMGFAKRATGGGAATGTPVIVSDKSAGATAWAATLTVSSNDLRISVTGENAKTIIWKATNIEVSEA